MCLFVPAECQSALRIAHKRNATHTLCREEHTYSTVHTSRARGSRKHYNMCARVRPANVPSVCAHVQSAYICMLCAAAVCCTRAPRFHARACTDISNIDRTNPMRHMCAMCVRVCSRCTRARGDREHAHIILFIHARICGCAARVDRLERLGRCVCVLLGCSQ